MHLFAASAAIRLPLMSYCPPRAVHCPAFASHPYTMRITGRGVPVMGAINEALTTIMWTATEVPMCANELAPNHFVALIPRDRVPISSVFKVGNGSGKTDEFYNIKDEVVYINLVSDDENDNKFVNTYR